MSFRAKPVSNLLLESLPKKIRSELLKQFTVVDWKFGEIVCEADENYEQVYFPVTGFVSKLTKVDKHPSLEMGLIGREGMLGASLVLGINKAPLQSIVQGSGTAFSIPAVQFEQALLEFPDLAIVLKCYIYVLMQQLVLAGACLHFHDVESRLARWLLMTQDRTQSDTLYLTHAFLAYMLGVRRSSVSLAADILQKDNLIKYSRGKITILNRKHLEKASCSCYQAMNLVYLESMISK